jgi:hypothetical protein
MHHFARIRDAIAAAVVMTFNMISRHRVCLLTVWTDFVHLCGASECGFQESSMRRHRQTPRSLAQFLTQSEISSAPEATSAENSGIEVGQNCVANRAQRGQAIGYLEPPHGHNRCHFFHQLKMAREHLGIGEIEQK